MNLRRIVLLALALAAGDFTSASQAALISAGTPTTTVPSALYDPLSTLSSPLSADQILVPVEITGANGLQDWSFDLAFNGSVVTPLDLGGLYQSVYQAQFSAVDPTLSNITASGFSGLGVLQGIAGFSSGVSGDGVLAFVLFQYQSGQNQNDPGFSVTNTQVTQVPEPGTLAMFAGVLLIGAVFARRWAPHRLWR
jgi:hypothetical protein